MRHAADADHIAAIDNTIRKLMGQGKRPLSVGFWFSLGHSSVVFIMVALIAYRRCRKPAGMDDPDATAP
jgi:high-affinity nickel-transport protein